MRSFKTIISAGFLASALALAGCGGGSDDNGMEEMPMEMTPEEKAQAEAEAAKAEAEEAKRKQQEAEDALQAEKDRQAQEEADAETMAAQKAAKALYAALSRERLQGAAGGSVYYSNVVPLASEGHDTMVVRTVATMGAEFLKASFVSANVTKADSFDDDGKLTITLDTANSRIAGSAFSTLASKEHDTNHFTGTGNDRTGHFRTSGTYWGVSGTYSCDPGDATMCTSVVDAETGNLELTGGAWTFTPADPKAMVAEGKSVEYGWWSNEPEGAMPLEVGIFFDPAAATGHTGTHTIGGKATYSGHAVGSYAIHRGVGQENDSGNFVAEAMLSATFGNIDVDNDGTGDGANISGMIDNFMDADGESLDWTVTLKKADITANNGMFASGANGTVWSMGDAKSDASGSWDGGLSGGANTEAPTAAGGVFTSEYGNVGRMAGAFGASLDK